MKVFEDERRLAALFAGGFEKDPELDLTVTFMAKRRVDVPPSFALKAVRVAELAKPKQGKAGEPQPVANVEKVDGRTWRFAQRIPADTARVHLETRWSDTRGPQHASDVLTLLVTTPLNSKTPSPILVGLDGPRLVMAINEAPVEEASSPPTLDFGDPGQDELKHLLEHIWRRLAAGLEPAWRHAFLRAGKPWPEPATLDDEERWARGITEALCGVTYTTPSVAHSNQPRAWHKKGEQNPKDKTDPKVNWTDGGVLHALQEGDDPVIPVLTECQHSCTIAAITRGNRFPLDVSKADGRKKLKEFTLMTANSNEAAFSQLTPKGSWAPLNAESKRAEFAEVVRPGSVYGWRSLEAGVQGRGAHVAFIIRVLSRGAGGKPARVQFLDTGGVFGEGPLSVPPLVNPEKLSKPPRIYDMFGSELDPLATKDPDEIDPTVPQPPPPPPPPKPKPGEQPDPKEKPPEQPKPIMRKAKHFVGVGTFAEDAAALKRGVERLARTRPLGFVRLVITRRAEDDKPVYEKKYDPAKQDEWLVYASPWLRMWTAQATQNFYVSRLAWALRDHPGRDQLKVAWLVDVPRGGLCKAVIDGGRTKTARELVKAGCPHGAPESGFHFLPLITYASRADGRVSADGFYRATHLGGTQTAETPVGRPRAIDALPVMEAWARSKIPASALASLPAFFRDEEPPPA